jgi:hypothetical protein
MGGPALLSALEAHCRVSAHAFAVKQMLARHRWSTTTRLRGRRCPAGAISEAARSADSGLARAARFVSDSPRLFERSAQRVASSAAQPRIEHRSGVCAKRRPPKCEPPPGTACREAASKTIMNNYEFRSLTARNGDSGMTPFADFHRQSLDNPDAFWAEQAKLIDWQVPPQQICDWSNPPFAHWFKGGTTNLCHNAVDRHLKDRADQAALIFVSTETEPGKNLHLWRTAHRSAARCRHAQGPGRAKGRPRADLHAHDCRGCVCHAGLRAHRGHPFGGVWRVCQCVAGLAHRGRRAEAHRQR